VKQSNNNCNIDTYERHYYKWYYPEKPEQIDWNRCFIVCVCIYIYIYIYQGSIRWNNTGNSFYGLLQRGWPVCTQTNLLHFNPSCTLFSPHTHVLHHLMSSWRFLYILHHLPFTTCFYSLSRHHLSIIVCSSQFL